VALADGGLPQESRALGGRGVRQREEEGHEAGEADGPGHGGGSEEGG
jgi:hypothetical protein